MSSHTSKSYRPVPSGVAAMLLLLTPMFVADADSSVPLAQTTQYVESLLGQHDPRYMLTTFGRRVPLQCAPEMHGA